MAGVFAAWLAGAGLLTWTQGLGKRDAQGNGAPQWPPPYVYMDLTVFMTLVSFVARANGTVGGLLAWGALLGIAFADNVFGDVQNLAQQLFKAPGGPSPQGYGSLGPGGTFAGYPRVQPLGPGGQFGG